MASLALEPVIMPSGVTVNPGTISPGGSVAYATLTVSAGGQPIGTLTNLGKGKYNGTFSLAANPGTIVVQSDQGGSASAAVASK